MALNAATLATALAPLLKTAHVNVGAADNAALSDFCDELADAIASAVVDHIKEAAAVSVVTACPAGAGTGTGTVG
jgi:hypothetical protein